MAKVYLVGETTYDIIFRNGQPTGAVVGGSMLNTSVTLGRLGIPVNFISRMGNDQIGNLSLLFLEENGVKCDFITRFEGTSRLALAFMDDDNNADYQFYKAEKAPSLNFPELHHNDKVVFGSTNALRDEGRNSLLLFLNQAHDKGVITIYDPNIREFGVLELVEVRRKFEENVHLTKILKGSHQDFKRLYETTDVDFVFDRVADCGVEILIVTSGAKPVELRTHSISMSIPFEPVKAISTIGAGDNFTSGLLYGLIKGGVTADQLQELSPERWTQIINFATTFAAEVCRSEDNYISAEIARKFK